MGRQFTKIPAETFKQLLKNAGVLCTNFVPNPGSGEANVNEEDMLGATSGGVNFTAVPTYSDMGEDIDNCPKNMAELKNLDAWEVKCSGTFVTITPQLAEILAAAADMAGGKLTPRNTVTIDDFNDLWYVCDYGTDGMIAIHLMNVLSTGGLAIQTGDRAKGKFPFDFTGHYSMDAQETPPFEVYIDEGTTA